jgi:hypothetical protein
MPTDTPAGFESWFAKLTGEAALYERGHLYVDSGLCWYGGKHSRCQSSFTKDPSALAHRNEGLLNLYYVHYDNAVGQKDIPTFRDASMENVNVMMRGADEYLGSSRRWNMFPNQAEVSECQSRLSIARQSLASLQTVDDASSKLLLTPDDRRVGGQAERSVAMMLTAILRQC